MDDCVAVVTAAVKAYRYGKQRIKNIDQHALVLGLPDEEYAFFVKSIESRERLLDFEN